MPDTRNAKILPIELPPTSFSVFTLNNVTWLVSRYSIVRFLFRFVCVELVSLIWFLQIWVAIYACLCHYQLVHFDKEIINANVYHHSLLGSILNISTVHLNGIWHLIWGYLLKTVLGGHPVLSGHYWVSEHSPRVRPLNTGFTVSSKKFTFAQSKRFPPKHNPPIRGNNS